MLAFTRADGAFHTTGGEIEYGNVRRIDMASFHATRVFSGMEATGTITIRQRDADLSAFGKAHQIHPGSPSVIVAGRDDTAAGENYVTLVPTAWGTCSRRAGADRPQWC